MTTPNIPLVTPELLRDLRKRAGFTQTELAERLGVDQTLLSRYESGKISIPLKDAERFINFLELPDHRLMVGEPERDFTPINPDDPYLVYSVRLRTLRDFTRSESPGGDAECDLNAPAKLEALIDSLLLLPRLVIAGRSDAGKSHVSNCLLGNEFLPADYQPYTRIPIAVVHKNYRPSFVTADCAMMKGSFDLTILNDASKFQERLAEVGPRKLLFDRAVHNNANDQEHGDIAWALVFLDSDLLRACILVDTPGFAAADADTDRAMEACRDAEILLYCSPAQGCFNQEDDVRLNHAIATLPCPETTDADFPPLANFLFVITHAGPQVSANQLSKIHSTVSERFFRSFGDDLLRKRLNNLRPPPTKDEVAGRFVPFWGELGSRHLDMRQKVLDLVRAHFPSYRKRLADRTIENFREGACSANRAKIEEWKNFLSRWEESIRRIQEAESNEPTRKEWVVNKKLEIEASIERHKRDTIAEFDVRYSSLINVDAIERLIRERYPSQDDAKNELGAHLLRKLQNPVGEDLEQKSRSLADEINNFLKGYASAGGQLPSLAFNFDATPGFDAAASFAGGLAGLTTFGALAVWATLLGNLGGYIIVAKVVGLLAAIGIPTGGVAAVVTAISALGGPIVFGIAIAIIAALGALLCFWKSWQRRMAEKVRDEFEKQGIRSKMRDQIVRYWTDTTHAFRTAASAVERDWEAYLKDLKMIVEADSKEAIESRIQALERINDFFARLPWFPFRRSEGENNK